jgi:chitinase
MTRRRLKLLGLLAVAALLLGVSLAPLTHAAGTLTATFAKDSDWGNGYQAKYTITNGTPTTITGWTVAFTLATGQTLGTFWDAQLTPQGSRVTATNRTYNATLTPGASTSFGFVVSYTASNAAPSDCTVNGAACAGGGGPTSTVANPTTRPTSTTGPTTTTRPTTTTTTPSGGGLPRHLLTGYWQDFVNGATPLRLSAVSSNYDIIAVAFAEADPSRPGAVTFTLDPGLSSALGGYTNANFTSDVQTLHSRGKKVIISVGGQNGTVRVSDSTSAANFASSVFGLMQTFGFDGVDIDLENGISPAAMTSALQQLSSRAGPNLVITLAPQTIDMQSTSGGYFQLALNIRSILTVVNTQYYNSGTMLGCDGRVYAQGTVDFMTALACIQLQGGLRPDQVGLGLPASSSAAGGGFVAPSVVNAALDCLARGTNCGTFRPPTTWPGIRGAMDWSINWDASSGNSFSNTVKPHLGTLP